MSGGLDIEGVLAKVFAEHEYDPDDDYMSAEGRTLCSCGFRSHGQHRPHLIAHVAAVLREQIAAAQAEALREFRDHCLSKAVGGFVAPGCPAAADYAFWMRVVAEIDLRAALVAPSRVPGEET